MFNLHTYERKLSHVQGAKTKRERYMKLKATMKSKQISTTFFYRIKKRKIVTSLGNTKRELRTS